MRQTWERKIKNKYYDAYLKMLKHYTRKTKALKFKDEQMLKKVEQGKLSKQEYMAWRVRVNLQLQKEVKELAGMLDEADEAAKDIANGQLPRNYQQSYNHHAYEIEKGLEIETDFELISVEAVQRAVEQRFFAKYDRGANDAYNRRRISSAITAAVIQGKSIPEIAKWLQPVCNNNKKAAIRNARTWINSAQNGGRYDAAVEMERIGVHQRKIWLAVTDMRTRFSHRLLDEEIRNTNERFSNGGMYAGDPSLPPEERYNCRCRTQWLPRGFEPDANIRHVEIGGYTYEEWKAGRGRHKYKRKRKRR